MPNYAIARRAALVLAAVLCLCAPLEAALTLRPIAQSIAVSETFTLLASGPVQSWTSSNAAVATVSSIGVVTGVGAGEATITAKYHGTKASMIVTVTGLATPTPLILTCPDSQTLASTDGSSVTTTYSATASGGTAPIVLAYAPTSGSAFSVGTSTVQVSATSADGQGAACSFTVTATYTPAVETRGPSSGITCPGGAVAVSAGAATIQAAVTANGTGTTFCLAAGTYLLTASITPKTGDTFVCAFGAILDGTNWVTSDTSQAAFRAHNEDIDDVTIKNCVIQHMPQRGVHFLGGTDRWIVEHNEITSTATAVNVGAGSDAIVRLNLIHHNTSGYLSFLATSPTFEDNEIAYNGAIQKVVASTDAVFRKNFVHHNTGDGIWFDTQNTGYVVDLNTSEDNGRFGIHSEINGQGFIGTNAVNRNGDTGIMIVTSKQVEVAGNTLVDNFRGIQAYLKCSVVGGSWGYDLTGNSFHDNVITITTSARSGSWAATLGWPTSDTACTALFLAPYLANVTKTNVYQANAYTVPNATTKFWMWGQGQFKSWAEWQALGNDTTGSVH